MKPRFKTPIIAFVGFFLCLLHQGLAVSEREAIVLLEPAEGTRTIHPHPHFAWRDVAGASSYQIQIALDAAFKIIVDEDTLPWQISRYFPATSLPLGKLYWRVTAMRENGGAKSESPIGTLERYRPKNVVQIPAGATYSDIQKLAEKAASMTPSILEFEPNATYRLTVLEKNYLIKLNKVNDLLIDGRGARLLIDASKARTGFVQQKLCRNITVQNIILDYEPEILYVLDILKVGKSGEGFIVQSRPGSLPFEWIPLKGKKFHEPRGFQGYIKKTASTGQFLLNAPNQFFIDPERIERIDDKRYQFYAKDPTLEDRIEEGDVYVSYDVPNGAGPRAHNFSLGECDNIVFSKVINRSIINGHAIGGSNHRLAFIGCEARCPEGKFHGDGNLLFGGVYGPWFENCVFEGGVDDTFNSRGHHYEMKSVSGNSFTYMSWGEGTANDFEVGDDVIIMVGWKIQARGKVKEATLRTNKATSIKVTLDCTIDPTGKLKDEGAAYNHTKNNPQYVVRNCTFNTTRRNAIILTANRALIENNLFFVVGQSSVGISKSTGGGLLGTDILIRNNRFEHCGWMTGGAPINTIFRGFKGQYMTNIIIERNEIFGYRDSVVGLNNAGNVNIRGNSFNNGIWNAMPESIPFKAEYHREVMPLVYALDSKDISLNNNTFVENRLRKRVIDPTNSRNVTASENILVNLNPWHLVAVGTGSQLSWTIGNTNPRQLSYSEFSLNSKAKARLDNVGDAIGLCAIQWPSSGRITAQLEDISGGTAGLMLRSTESPSSPFAAIFSDGGGNLSLLSRASESAPLKSSKVQGIANPIWLRIEHKEGNAKLWWSRDNFQWIAAAEIPVALKNEAVAGLCLLAGSGENEVNAKFDRVDTLKNYMRWSFNESLPHDRTIDHIPCGEMRVEKGELLRLTGSVSRRFAFPCVVTKKSRVGFDLEKSRPGLLSMQLLNSSTGETIPIKLPTFTNGQNFMRVDVPVGAGKQGAMNWLVIELKKVGEVFPDMSLRNLEIVDDLL